MQRTRKLFVVAVCVLVAGLGLAGGQITNWAGNIKFEENRYFAPSSVDEVIEIVTRHNRVGIIGSAHSFNNCSQTTGAYLSTKNLNKVLSCCDDTAVVVQAGITYAQLGKYLHDKGFAIPNYASLPHISVGGSISTASHGSGITNGNLASDVKALKFVSGEGKLVSLQRGDADFQHMVVSVGAAGVIVELTLDVEPTFDVQQCIYNDIKFEDLEEPMPHLVNETYSLSLFSRWSDNTVNGLWRKMKIPANSIIACPDLAGKQASKVAVHPDPTGPSAEACSKPDPAPSYIQLPHFLPEFTPSHGDELQTEYQVKLEYLWPALAAIFQFEKDNKVFKEILYVSEVRFIKGDSFTLSPQRVLGDSVGIGFAWKYKLDEILTVLPRLEEALAPFHPIPHWGKVFDPKPHRLAARYGPAKVAEFKALVRRHDPEGKFMSDFMATCLQESHDEL